MHTTLKIIVLSLLIVLSVSACDNGGGLKSLFGLDDFDVNVDGGITIETDSRAGLDGATLRRIDDINRRIDTVSQMMDDGLEVGVDADTRQTVERSFDRLERAVQSVNRTADDGIEQALRRVDRALTVLENDLKLEVTVGLDQGTLNQVNQLINTIDAAPDKWEATATTIISTLEASSSKVGREMADEIRDIIDKARRDSEEVAAIVGIESRCNVDFLSMRAGSTVDELIGRTLPDVIRDVLYDQPAAPEIQMPWVCQILPTQINLIASGEQLIFAYQDMAVQITGFNFVDQNLPKASIIDEAGRRIDSIRLSPFRTSAYQIQLNLQQIDFSPVPARSRLVLEWPHIEDTNAIAIMLPGQPTPTPTSAPQPTLIVIEPTANVREGPGVAYRQLGLAQQGAEYLIIGKNGDGTWWQIDFNGSPGWLAAELVTVTNIEAIEVAAEIPLLPAAPPAPCVDPSVPSFTASVTSITAGESVTLSWGEVANATEVRLDDSNGFKTVPTPGEETLTPTQTTTYQLKATGCANETTVLGTITIEVNDPPTPTFTPIPTATPVPTATPQPPSTATPIPFTCFEYVATIVGTDGNDKLTGTSGDDVIVGRGGNDEIDGGGGNDVICGDDGNDTIYGGDGDDTINGNVGNDYIEGGNGNDFIRGGQDNDTILGLDGNDDIYGDWGDDSLNGNVGDDTVSGGEGNDDLGGGQDNDIVNGDEGDDIVRGGLGDDILDGNEGQNQIDGMDGDDTCKNGPAIVNCEA